MASTVYTALVKLNKTAKEYTKHAIIVNDTGVLLVNHGLFVVSFDSFDEFKNNVDYTDLTLKTEIDL